MFQIATSKHIAGILGLMREYYLADGYPFEETAARAALEELIRNPDFGELWVATEGDQVVAYIAVTFGFSFEFGGRDAFIDELVVAPSRQGQGLGTKALAVAEAVCRTAGVRAGSTWKSNAGRTMPGGSMKSPASSSTRGTCSRS